MCRSNSKWALLVVVAVLSLSGLAQADLIVNEFGGTFGRVTVNAADLKQFTLADGMITLTLSDDVDGMTFDGITFDLTGYAGPLGVSNPVNVVDDTVTIRLESTMAKYDVVSADLTQLLNSPIAVGFIELELALNSNNLAVGGQNVIMPSTLSSVVTINGLKVTVVEQGGQKNGRVQVGGVASASLTAIPEPTTCTMAGIGLMIFGLGLLRGRRR